MLNKDSGTGECAMDNAVLTHQQDGVLTITMNRPKSLNALDWDLAEALLATIQSAEQDETVRCVVVRGDRTFMAGGDLNWFAGKLDEPSVKRRVAIRELIDLAHKSILSIRRMPKPVIGSLEGAVAGFGFSLAMACDLSIAADSTVFTLAYINIGTSPDGGSTFALPRIVGPKRAAEIAFLGDRFDAATAKDLGLVNWVVPADDLEAKTEKLAVRLAQGPTAALARTKALLQQSQNATLESQLQAEIDGFVACADGHDFAEGISSFIGKRKPRFTGT